MKSKSIIFLKTNNNLFDKLINNEPSLSNEELLAIIIGVGNQYEHGNRLSTNIVSSVGHVRNLLDLNYYELIKTKGMTNNRACSLIAAFELSKRVYNSKLVYVQFDKAESVYEYMRPLLIGEKVECFYALYLDSRCQLIERRLLTKGTSTAVIIDFKETLRHGIKNSCYAIVLVHNHLSGISKPSDEDIAVTKRFYKASAMMNIILVDHVIVGDGEFTSIAREHKEIFDIKIT